MLNLTPIHYLEGAWLVLAMFFGSRIYQALYNDNLFINVAIIFAVASPVFLSRFLKASKLSIWQRRLVLIAYIVACLGFALAIGNNRYEAGDYFFIPLLCAVAAVIFRWLRETGEDEDRQQKA